MARGILFANIMDGIIMVVTNKSIVKNHLNLTKFFFIFFVFELIISCSLDYHGLAHDYGEQQKKQCHYKNSLFLFHESLYHIFHGANIVFFFEKVLHSYKKVSTFCK